MYSSDHLTEIKMNNKDVRKKILTLSAIGLVDFGVISMYQTGVFKRLPDLPGKIFDSNKVNAAPDAYIMGIPDGPISAVAYAAIMVLAAKGSNNNTKSKPLFDILLSSIILGNAAGAAYYMYNMIFKQKKICIYCVTGALINFASAAIVAPIAIRCFQKWYWLKSLQDHHGISFV
jgi:uncharacterized membrane protein